MTTASLVTPSSSLESLLHQLRSQMALTDELAAIAQIRCGMRQGTLIILGDHFESLTFGQATLFSQWQHLTSTILLDVGLPEVFLTDAGTLPVHLYLRWAGQERPYARHVFNWSPADALNQVFDQPNWAGQVNHGDRPPHPEADSAGTKGWTAADAADADVTALAVIAPPMAVPDNLAAHRAEAVEAVVGVGHWLTQIRQTIPLRMVAAIAGVSLLGSLGFVLSRPCVIGQCERLQQADGLTQAAVGRLAADDSPQAVQQAQADVHAAIRLVQPIPPWSRQHDTAQAQLANYQSQAEAVKWIQEAQNKATRAAEKSQNPPHPVEVWVEVHILWRQAITYLAQVPETNAFYPIAKAKFEEYEANQLAIGHRIDAEHQAESALNAAMESGQLAMHHMENADSLPNWQLAYREWQAAINNLRRIPRGTLAHTEAQQLLKAYQEQLSTVNVRLTRETFANQVYTEALTAAQQARVYEQQNQWTMAVVQWQKALTAVQQVPQGTTSATGAQSLVPTYESALAIARDHLRQVINLQKAQQDLTKLCPAGSAICRYGTTADSIRVDLAKGYDQAIIQAITPPDARVYSAIAPTTVQQANWLLQQVTALGNRTQMAVELYDANGALIARYRPDLGGFVKH